MSEWVVLFKKTSTARRSGSLKQDARKLKDYIESYLDEEAKALKQCGQPEVYRYTNPSTKEKHRVDTRTTIETGLKKGVDYLTKEKKGEIKLHGFLRRLVFQYTGKPVDSLTNLEKAAAVEEIWRLKLEEKNLKKMAHKIVLSLDPEVTKEMTEKGIPVDEELHRIVAETMGRYQDRFYPGHQLGYLVGIHHDRKHIHAHILLYPQTAAGKPINVSHWSKARLPDGTETRVDYQGFIKETVEKLGVEMYANKVQGVRRNLPLPEEYGIQEKLLAEVALLQCQQEMQDEKPNAKLDTRELVQRALMRKSQLMKMSDQTVRQYIEAEYERRIKVWDRMTTPQAEEAVQSGEGWQKRLKMDIDNIYSEKSEGYEKSRELHGQRRSITEDAFRAKKMLLGWRQHKWGSALFTDTSEGRWWAKRMRQPDELGAMMENIHNDLNFRFREIDRVSVLPGMKGYAKLKKQEIIQRHLAEMQKLKKLRAGESTKAIEKQRKEKEEKAEKLARYRLLLQRVSLNLMDAKAKLAGRPPRYHQQYAYWQKSNRVLPISLARRERPDPTLPSNAVLMNRQEAINQSVPATREEYLQEKDRPQESAVEMRETNREMTEIGSDDVTEISETVVGSRVGATPAISMMYSPREIVSNGLDREAVNDATERHREAMRRMLHLPRNDRIDHGTVSPWLSADDIHSFDSVDI